MTKITLFSCLTGAAVALSTLVATPKASAQDEVDFSEGVFILNEDWFGHNNSTVNYLLPDATDGNYWYYRVFKSNNEGVELGTTAASGEIWNGKFYIICKQDANEAFGATGGRINVADAKTMQVEYQISTIGSEDDQADGRSFVGVDEHKGYVSTSNGVWILDLDSHEIIGKIEGSDSGEESLYSGQSGTMVRAAGKIFIANQDLGLLVVDPAEDKVIQTISFDVVAEGAGIGSVVVAKDGSLWCSVASDGNGGTLPYLLCVDPETFATDVVDIPSDVYAPANSWYAWTPDGFCASSVTNTLFWNGGESSWDCGREIFKFDVDNRSFEKIIDLTDDEDGWSVYGCSMRVHPNTDELYLSLFQGWGSQNYTVRRYTADGQKIQDYPMIENYWFPSLPVFAQSDEFSGVAKLRMDIASDIVISSASGSIQVQNGAGEFVEVYTISGSLLYRQPVISDYYIVPSTFAPGIYVVKVGAATSKIRL